MANSVITWFSSGDRRERKATCRSALDLRQHHGRAFLDLVARELEAFELGAQSVSVALKHVEDALLGVEDGLVLVALALFMELALEEELGDAATERLQMRDVN